MNALLEREIKKDEVKAQADVIPAHTSSVEEDLHAQRMHENFKRLLGESGNVKDSAPVLAPEKEEVPSAWQVLHVSNPCKKQAVVFCLRT